MDREILAFVESVAGSRVGGSVAAEARTKLTVVRRLIGKARRILHQYVGLYEALTRHVLK